jgi:anti-anti-sigma factor
MAGLVLTHRRLAGEDVICVVGELDHANVRLLYQELDGASLHDRARLLLDFTHLDYIDSAGITFLYTSLDELPEAAWLGVLNAGPGALRLLTIAGLTGSPRFRLISGREEAEEALRSPSDASQEG